MSYSELFLMFFSPNVFKDPKPGRGGVQHSLTLAGFCSESRF